jgi:hypothetical protein
MRWWIPHLTRVLLLSAMAAHNTMVAADNAVVGKQNG